MNGNSVPDIPAVDIQTEGIIKLLQDLVSQSYRLLYLMHLLLSRVNYLMTENLLIYF